MVLDSIAKCEDDMRIDFHRNIVLSGGTTMMPHLQDRLRIDVQRHAVESVKVKVVAEPERHLCCMDRWVHCRLTIDLSAEDHRKG